MKLLEGRPRLRFALAFALLAGVGLTVLHAFVFPSDAFDAYLAQNAALATSVMRLLGFDVTVDGQLIAFEGSVSRFERACDVSQVVLLHACAVLAFPQGRRRLLAVLGGTAVIFVANLVRVGTLLCVGAYWPTAFEAVHLYLWPVLLLLLAMGMWFAWARRSAGGELP